MGECGPRLEIPGNNLYTVAYSRRNTRHNRNMGGGGGERREEEGDESHTASQRFYELQQTDVSGEVAVR